MSQSRSATATVSSSLKLLIHCASCSAFACEFPEPAISNIQAGNAGIASGPIDLRFIASHCQFSHSQILDWLTSPAFHILLLLSCSPSRSFLFLTANSSAACLNCPNNVLLSPSRSVRYTNVSCPLRILNTFCSSLVSRTSTRLTSPSAHERSATSRPRRRRATRSESSRRTMCAPGSGR